MVIAYILNYYPFKLGLLLTVISDHQRASPARSELNSIKEKNTYKNNINYRYYL